MKWLLKFKNNYKIYEFCIGSMIFAHYLTGFQHSNKFLKIRKECND